MSMKKELLKTVNGLLDQGINLMETPAHFTWSYPESPYVKFQMLISIKELPQQVEEPLLN